MQYPPRSLSEIERTQIRDCISEGQSNIEIEQRFRVSRQQVAAHRAWLTMRGETMTAGREVACSGAC
jgi:DNA-binding CsgD family transcriptional regulator